MRLRRSIAPPARSYRSRWSFVVPITPQLAHPFLNPFSPSANPRRSDSSILFKRALFAHCTDPHAILALFKPHPIARAHPQPPSHLARYGDLPLARDFRLVFHSKLPFPYCNLDSLLLPARVPGLPWPSPARAPLPCTVPTAL